MKIMSYFVLMNVLNVAKDLDVRNVFECRGKICESAAHLTLETDIGPSRRAWIVQGLPLPYSSGLLKYNVCSRRAELVSIRTPF
jgi:hypothetical protein